MNKKEASEKVAKLLRLAKGSTNPHEAATAKAQAEILMQKHGLTPADLAAGQKAAAFDDLFDQIYRYVQQHPNVPKGIFDTSSVISDVIMKAKNIAATDKAAAFDKIVTGTSCIFAIFGDNPTISEINSIMTGTLKKHEITT